MVGKNKHNKNIVEIYECPKCHKQYKTLGWYKRHFTTSKAHVNIIGVLPYIKKIIVKERDLQTIIEDTMKEVLKNMDLVSPNNKYSDWERAKEDHERRIKLASKSKKGNMEDFKNVVNELKTYFKKNDMVIN